MRTTLTLDDTLLARAHEVSGQTNRSALLHEALRALIEREAARNLARLAGSLPSAKNIPRRRENENDPD
ncbi:MAG: type II toxin-antitoxin system VapB family antitoxin [Pseudomonadota bacterium]